MLPERYPEVGVYGRRLVGQGALLNVPAFDAPVIASSYTDIRFRVVRVLLMPMVLLRCIEPAQKGVSKVYLPATLRRGASRVKSRPKFV